MRKIKDAFNGCIIATCKSLFTTDYKPRPVVYWPSIMPPNAIVTMYVNQLLFDLNQTQWFCHVILASFCVEKHPATGTIVLKTDV